MEDFKERVVIEAQELSNKIGQLQNFVNSGTFAGLDNVNQMLLLQQLQYMVSYGHILMLRIARF